MALSHLIIVTGASRGFGKALAIEFASRFKESRALTMVLFARAVESLSATSDAIAEVAPAARIVRVGADFSFPSKLDEAWRTSVAPLFAEHPDQAILLSNSGSLGPTGAAEHWNSLPELEAAVTSNITSTLWIAKLFVQAVQDQVAPQYLRKLQDPHGGHSALRPSVIVDISSLVAIKPFATEAVYCCTKAARDMTMAVIALDEANRFKRLTTAGGAATSSTVAETTAGSASTPPKPSLVTLCYAPGPLDTDMQAELRACTTLDPEASSFFAKMKSEGRLILPERSAAVCADLVTSLRFESGSHVDYYDAAGIGRSVS